MAGEEAASPSGRGNQRPDVDLGAVPADVPCVCRPFGPPPIRRLPANDHTCDLDISMSTGDMGRLVKLVMGAGGHVPRENRLDGATLDAVRSPEFEGLARLSHAQFAQLLREFLLYFSGSIYWHAELGNTDPPGRVASGVYAGFQSLMSHPWATSLAMHILDGPLWLSPGFVACASWAVVPAYETEPGQPSPGGLSRAVLSRLYHTKIACRMTSVLHHFCITYLLVHADLMLHDPANTAEPLVAALKRYGPVHRALRLATSAGASLVRTVAQAEAATIELTLSEDGRAVVTASRCEEVRVNDSILRVNGRGLIARSGEPLTSVSVQAAWARQCAAHGRLPLASTEGTVTVELVPRAPGGPIPPTTTLTKLQTCIVSRIRGVIELTRDRYNVHIGEPSGLRVTAPACLLETGDVITHVGGWSLSDKPFEEARLYFLERLTKVESKTSGRFTYILPTLAVRRGPYEKFTVEGHLPSVSALRLAPMRDGRCRCKDVGPTMEEAGCSPCAFKTVCCTAMQEVWRCGVIGWAMSPQLLLKVARHMPDIVRRHGWQHDMLPETHDVLPNVAIRCSPQTGLPTGGFARVTLATNETKFMLVPMSARERHLCETVFRCGRALASTGSAARCQKGAGALPKELWALILSFILPENVVYQTLLSGTHEVPVPEYITIISAHRIAIASHYHGAGMVNMDVAV